VFNKLAISCAADSVAIKLPVALFNVIGNLPPKVLNNFVNF